MSSKVYGTRARGSFVRFTLAFCGLVCLLVGGSARAEAAMDRGEYDPPLTQPTAQNGWTVTAGEVPQRHAPDDPQWQNLAEHLPDPKTGSSERLEVAGDVLRARRYSEDALEFYQAALERGADRAKVLNKIGVAELAMMRPAAARLNFLQVIRLDRRNAEAWNNLGAVEYLQAHFGAAVSDYKKAVKLNRTSAVFHANLGLALFDQKEYGSARREISEALRLDPEVFQVTSGAGISARVMSQSEQARFAFEMASLYAGQGQTAAMLEELRRAGEFGGLDLRGEMKQDAALAKFVDDARVLAVLRQAAEVRNPGSAVAGVKLPVLAK